MSIFIVIVQRNLVNYVNNFLINCQITLKIPVNKSINFYLISKLPKKGEKDPS